jgi:hypothetical protein
MMPRTSCTAGGHFRLRAPKGGRDADHSRERNVDACGAGHSLTLEGWPAATIEATTRAGSARRQGPSSYRFNFHKVAKGGWQYIEDDVDRYCPDRELILALYEEADQLLQQQAQARP